MKGGRTWRLALVIGLCHLASTAAPVRACLRSDRSAASVEAVRETEDAWLKALREHDRAGVERILALEFVHTTYRGERRTRAEELVQVGQGRTDIDSQTLEDVSVRVYGETAVLMGTNVVTGPGFGTVRLRFTDVFVLRDGRWQAVTAQETLQAETAGR